MCFTLISNPEINAFAKIKHFYLKLKLDKLQNFNNGNFSVFEK